MTDATARGPFGRTLVYFALAAFIAVTVLVAASALSSNARPTLEFSVTVKVGEQEMMAAGKTRLTDGRIDVDGSRLSFAGSIAGDEVQIEGKATLPGQTATRTFRAAGRMTDNRATLPVKGPDGRRIGALSLELSSD
jgi:hypothetical protein